LGHGPSKKPSVGGEASNEVIGFDGDVRDPEGKKAEWTLFGTSGDRGGGKGGLAQCGRVMPGAGKKGFRQDGPGDLAKREFLCSEGKATGAKRHRKTVEGKREP